MRTYKLLGVAAALSAASFTILPSAASSGSGTGSATDHVPVCLPAAAVGVANCDAIQLLNPAQNWLGTHGPVLSSGNGPGKKPGGGGGSGTLSGYTPGDLESAYGLTSLSPLAGSGETVAIVDAYNDPNAASDLATYRSTMGISKLSTGQFSQVAQDGTTNLPRSNSSWAEEISLDLDMVSAICSNCKILLVEANSASITDLASAAQYAAEHASVVSNSYGAAEFSGETSYDTYYNHSGVPITVSAGDSGYGVQYPAASPYVTAVGGTTLIGSRSSGWTQTVWSGTGSGCSAYERIPQWQPETTTCSMRTVADTAAVANPNTGVAVYDSFHEPGWMVFGGTSVASPIIASIYALAGSTNATAESLYSDSLTPVKSGSNGTCGNYLCNAAYSTPYTYLSDSGLYNGPTGVGTPNGTDGTAGF